MATIGTAALVVTVWLSLASAATLPQQKGLRQVDTDLRQVDASPYTVEAEADRVLELPGAGKPDFGLFSG